MLDGNRMRGGFTYLPVALNLDGRSAIVIGGGEAACLKAGYLSDFGIQTTVLAQPEGQLDPRLEVWNREGQISLLREQYSPGRLDGHWLAVISTGDRGLDRRVAADAHARHLLVNIVDDPQHCDFFASGYVRRGTVSIAVNTGGVSPGFSAALRERIDDLFGFELEEHLRNYTQWREQVHAGVRDARARECLWRQLRAAGLYRVLEDEGETAAGAMVQSYIKKFAAQPTGDRSSVDTNCSA